MKPLPLKTLINGSTAYWSRLVHSWSARTSQFFFDETGPQGLAFVRIVFFAFVAWKVFNTNLSALATAPAALWDPVMVFGWLAEPPFSGEFLNAVQLALFAACVCCALGLGFRLFSLAAVPLALIHYGLPNCYGKISHGTTMTVLAIAIFAMSHAAAAWSLDAWFDRRRGIPRPLASGEFTWPLRTLQALFAVVMCAAGISKLRTSGLEWALSDNLLNTMLRRHYQNGADLGGSISLTLVHYPWLCKVLAAGSLFIELTAPLALFSRRYRWFVIPSLLGMQIGIYLTMDIRFSHFMLLYIVWVDWNAVFTWVEARISARLRLNGADFPRHAAPLPGDRQPTSSRAAA
jgi:hypothetical protein